jgi:predicted RNase H-like HicB family nuclease
MEQPMNFPVVIHKDNTSDYGVCVPDLPGCISAGATVDEALAMVREAIELHLEGLIEAGNAVPLASPIEKLRADPEFAGGIWAIVHVDESSLRVKFARIGITMPERVFDAIDRYVKANGETRSALLTRAAARYIGRDAGSLPQSNQNGTKPRSQRKNTKAARPGRR